ncbi:MAG: hypothetical protein ACXVC6_01165 [Bacteroidia bacterium]
MKKLILGLSIFICFTATAQVKDYIGKWELRKTVTVKGDTQLIKNIDPRFVWYNFEYNNTFTSFSNEKKEEITGRFGYEFKTKTLKIKNPMLSKTRTAIGDYDIVVYTVSPDYFVEMREEGKKMFSYWIYYRIK